MRSKYPQKEINVLPMWNHLDMAQLIDHLIVLALIQIQQLEFPDQVVVTCTKNLVLPLEGQCESNTDKEWLPILH